MSRATTTAIVVLLGSLIALALATGGAAADPTLTNESDVEEGTGLQYQDTGEFVIGFETVGDDPAVDLYRVNGDSTEVVYEDGSPTSTNSGYTTTFAANGSDFDGVFPEPEETVNLRAKIVANQSASNPDTTLLNFTWTSSPTRYVVGVTEENAGDYVRFDTVSKFLGLSDREIARYEDSFPAEDDGYTWGEFYVLHIKDNESASKIQEVVEDSSEEEQLRRLTATVNDQPVPLYTTNVSGSKVPINPDYDPYGYYIPEEENAFSDEYPVIYMRNIDQIEPDEFDHYHLELTANERRGFWETYEMFRLYEVPRITAFREALSFLPFA